VLQRQGLQTLEGETLGVVKLGLGKEDLTKERKEKKDEERGMLSHSLYFRSRAIG
jgi:hypothetical protein